MWVCLVTFGLICGGSYGVNNWPYWPCSSLISVSKVQTLNFEGGFLSRPMLSQCHFFCMSFLMWRYLRRYLVFPLVIIEEWENRPNRCLCELVSGVENFLVFGLRVAFFLASVRLPRLFIFWTIKHSGNLIIPSFMWCDYLFEIWFVYEDNHLWISLGELPSEGPGIWLSVGFQLAVLSMPLRCARLAIFWTVGHSWNLAIPSFTWYDFFSLIVFVH